MHIQIEDVSVKSLCATVKLRVDSLYGKQQEIEKAVRILEENVHNLNDEREILHLDIDAL